MDLKKEIEMILADATRWSLLSTAKQLVIIIKTDPVRGRDLLADVCIEWQRQDRHSTGLIVDIVSCVSKSITDFAPRFVKLVYNDLLSAHQLCNRLASAQFVYYLLQQRLSVVADTFSFLKELLPLSATTTADVKVAASILCQTSILLQKSNIRMWNDLLIWLEKVEKSNTSPETKHYVVELMMQLTAQHQGVQKGGSTWSFTVTNILKTSTTTSQAIQRLRKIQLQPGDEAQVSRAIVRLCLNNTFYDKLYISVAKRLCWNSKAYRESFVSLFSEYLARVYTLNDKELRHLAWFFGTLIKFKLLASKKVLSFIRCDHLGHNSTSSMRAFLSQLFKEILTEMSFHSLKRMLEAAGVDTESKATKTFLSTL